MNEIDELHVASSTTNIETEDYAWGPGIHRDYVIHYVACGRGFFEADGKKYALKEGECFAIFPDQKVKYYPDPAEPWTYLWVDFNGVKCAEYIARTAFAEYPVCSAGDSVGQIMREFTIAIGEHMRLRNDGLLRLLLAELIASYPATAVRKTQDYIDAARQYVAANSYRHSFGVSELAEAVGVERSYLYRLFKEKEGVSPMEYIIKVRLENAKKLLSTAGARVKLVSYSVGYDNPLYFSNCFKKRYGVSPKEYIKKATE